MKLIQIALSTLAAALLLTVGAMAQFVEDFENGNPDSWQIDFNGTFNGSQIQATSGALAAGNPGSGLEFLNQTVNLWSAWWLNSPSSVDWSGNLRGKGVTGFSLDMIYVPLASSPFGNHMYVVLADDGGTPTEYSDDILCWSPFDGTQYSFLGLGPQGISPNTWTTVSWPCDTSSNQLPTGWTVSNWNNTYVGTPQTDWNLIVQDCDYIAFVNNAPWGSNPFGSADYTFDNLTMTVGAVGTPYCFCDGSGAGAPCANTGAAGNGCANGSSAAGANLAAQGNPSVSASTLVLSGAGTPPNQPGLYFQGDVRTNGGLGLAFGDGLRCAGGTVVRLQVVTPDGNGDSATSIDLAVKGGATAGQTLYYQLWYRDPLGSPCASFFNTTNALEIIWGS